MTTPPVQAIRDTKGRGCTVRSVSLPDNLVTIKDAAAQIGVHPRTIRRWITAGRISGWRLGPRMMRVNLSEVLAQIQPHDVERSA